MKANELYKVMSTDEQHTIACALRVAAARYRVDAKDLAESSIPPLGRLRLIEQFTRQAEDAEKLLEEFE